MTPALQTLSSTGAIKAPKYGANKPTSSTGPPGSREGPPGFASVLDKHVARTAGAEGQKKTASGSRGHHNADADTATAQTAQAAAVMSPVHQDHVDQAPANSSPVAGNSTPAAANSTPAAANSTPAAEESSPAFPQAAAPAADAVATALPPTTPPAQAATPAPATAPAPVTATAPAPVTATPAAPAAAAPPVTPAATTTTTQPTTTPSTDATSNAPAPPTTSTPAAPATDTAPVSILPPTGDHSGSGKPASDQPASDQPPSGQPQTGQPVVVQTSPADQASVPTANVAAHGHEAPTTATLHPVADPQAATATVAPNLGAPVPATAGAAPVIPSTPAHPGGSPAGAVPLARAFDTVRTTIELGTRQGFSQARIQLAPASLGAISIHLQRTDAGVVAHVVAEHAAAAETLQQGSEDLKRSLESAGVNLLGLDIQTRGDGGSQARHSAQSGSAAASRSVRDEDNATVAGVDATEPSETTLVLPGGALVNVLA